MVFFPCCDFTLRGKKKKTGMETDGLPRPVNWETAKDGEERRSGRGTSSHSHISKRLKRKNVIENRKQAMALKRQN